MEMLRDAAEKALPHTAGTQVRIVAAEWFGPLTNQETKGSEGHVTRKCN